MSSSAGHGHFQCMLLEIFIIEQCSLLIRSASSLECNQSGCGVSIWDVPGPSSGCFVMTKSAHQHKIIKGGLAREEEELAKLGESLHKASQFQDMT